MSWSERAGYGRVGVLAVVCAAGLPLGCNTYEESLKEGLGSVKPQACALGECWWSKVDADGCYSVGRPTVADRPKKGDTKELPPFYFGISSLRLGETRPSDPEGFVGWRHFGFDLDGVCSNSDTCLAGPSDKYSCKAPVMTDDGDKCRDNVFGQLEPIAAATPGLGEKFGIREDKLNCGFRRGSYTIILKVSRYNGQANDDSVRIDLYLSPGVERPADWSCCDHPAWPNEAPIAPLMRWYVDEADLEGRAIEAPGTLPDSRTADPAAFVRNGYLYATLTDGTLLRFIGDRGDYPGFALRVFQGFLIGRLTRVSGGYGLEDAMLAGRLGTQELRDNFRQIGFTPESAGSNWVLLDNYLAGNADVLKNGDTDPEASCDAISMAVGFTTMPLTPGETFPVSALSSSPPPPPPTKCGQTWETGGGGGQAGQGGGGAAGSSGGASGSGGVP